MENISLNSPAVLHVDDLKKSLPISPEIIIKKTKPPLNRRFSRNTNSTHLNTVVCKDGERTAHLTKLAGHLISKGMPIGQVIENAQDWNSRNEPPLDEEKVVATCESIKLTHQNNHPEYIENEEFPPLFDPETARVTDYIYSAAPVREYLIMDFIPARIVGGIVARGGSSKTQYLLQLAVSVAAGIALCGHWTVQLTGKVLMLLAEDDEGEIHRRLEAIVRQLALSGNHAALEIIAKNLHIKSMIGENNLMTTTAYSGEVEGTDYIDRLIKTILMMGGVVLVVVDPVSRFRGGEENSNEDATRFIEALERVRLATGATVLVAHHANKGSMSADEASSSAARGASAFTDGLRWQMNLTSPNKKDAQALQIPVERKHEYVVATVTKSNYTPPLAPLVLHRGDGGYLTAYSPVSLRAKKEDRDLAAVIRCIAGIPAPLTARRIEALYGGENKPLKIGIKRVGELIQTGIARGYLSGAARKPVTVTEHGTKFEQGMVERIADVAMVPHAKLSAHDSINKSMS